MSQIDTKHTKRSLTSSIKNMLFIVKVEGESCWPHLIPEKHYLATNILKPKIGNFIVFKNPKNQEEIFVKRVKNIKKDSYLVEGTVSWSKSFLIDKNLILGKLISS